MQPRRGAFTRRDWFFQVGTQTAIAALVPAYANAGILGKKTSAPPLRGEFSAGKDGRLILLPVKLDETPLLCLLDTGASLSGFDESLKERLGEIRGSRILQTPAGRKEVATYKWPRATLHGQSLMTGQPVASLDLEDTRRATNQNIRGVIGMDVLRRSRVQIDFDRGIIRFLETLPRDISELGSRIPLKYWDNQSPVIVGSIGDDLPEEFLIDTGAQGNSLTAEAFDNLLKQNQISLGASSASVTVAGVVRGHRGRLARLAVGPFTHSGLRFSRLNLSCLGLRYFSRYRVTIDFPGGALYLQKGIQYSRVEPSATSGVTLGWIDGDLIIDGVKQGGPADAAGLRPEDVVVRINRRDARELDQFSVRELLTSTAGQHVLVRVRRDGGEFDTELVLAPD